MEQLIGIPYKDKGRDFDGCDCWGLARLFNKLILDKDIPDYSGIYLGAEDVNSVASAIECNKGNWTEVTYDTLRPGDVILIRGTDYIAHVGVHLRGSDMLHTMKGRDSVKENFLSHKWKHKIEGYYRWET